MFINPLERLFSELQAGEKFGKVSYWDYYNNRPYMYMTFNCALEKHYCKNLLLWSAYGSSANKNTLKDLEWILENIFHKTAAEFLKEYTTRTEYDRMRACINSMIERGEKL